MGIFVVFVTHWFACVFCQTFFLHRYGAHHMFSMSRGWERFFHLLTFLCQGSSYLEPRAYAILHREHHAYSDTPRDPHSPRHSTNALTMMWRTKLRYEAYVRRQHSPEARFDGDVPVWPWLDGLSQRWSVRLTFIGLYTALYWALATELWMWALLPFHFVMGPVHGAIVNWCGHRYGYRNHGSSDDSRNTLPFDFLTMGELFQNNHHRFSRSPNFATRVWEFDPCYPIIVVLDRLRIIRLPQRVQQAARRHDLFR